MDLTIEILGKRLCDLRKYFEYHQGQIAAEIKTNQSQISNLERGMNTNIVLLINYLNFFKDKFPIHDIFKEDFDIETSKNRNDEIKKDDSIIYEKLKLAKEELANVTELLNDIIEKT